jgi:callose synthase
MPFDLVFFQLQRIKTVGELTSYNIVPLDAPSSSNATGVFPEVS